MAELVTLSESEYRCSECTFFELRLYRDNVKKTAEEWNQFINREFAKHLRRYHTRKEFQQFTATYRVSL